MFIIKKFKVLSIVLITIIVLVISQSGCYPGDALTVQQTDMVITTYDKQADFSTYKTYAMSDTVVHYNGNTGEIIPPDEDDGISREFDELIINLIESNMASRGYQRVAELDPTSVDLVLLASASTTSNRGYSFIPIWPWNPWGPWGPWYPPGFVPVPFQFTTGTVYIDMADAKDRNDEEKTLPLRWDAAMNGLLQGGSSLTEKRITDAINQAFAQSEYLQAGN